MTGAKESNEPFWLAGVTAPRYPALEADLEVDVAVVGGGIVGLTAAYLLARAGRRVALLEARRIGRQATGRSTAKVTSQHGAIYGALIDSLGEADARRYAEANQGAVATVAALCKTLDLDCGLRRCPAYVYAGTAEEAEKLELEAEAALRLGLPAAYLADPGLPVPAAGALRFDAQLRFDPYRYLLGLAEAVAAEAQIFEQSRVLEVEHGEPCRLRTESASVTARDVIVATQMPVVPDGLFFTKAYAAAHPVAAARIRPEQAPEGMFISAEAPTHSFRAAERDGQTWLVAAGGSYKPGHAKEQDEMVADLRDFLRTSFGLDQPEYLWTSEDFGSMDKLPFIGRASSGKPHLLVATGFGGWGLSSGTLAGGILSDAVLDRPNPVADLFDATRVRPLQGGGTFVSENAKAGLELVGDRLLQRKAGDFDAIAPGQGGVVKVEGEQLAVRKGEDGSVTALSAICTHLGCVVGWNAVDRTWDCPCHGSRFDSEGQVLYGPATAPLKPREFG